MFRAGIRRSADFRFDTTMPITFFCGSGSPPAWRVWLALEFKGLAYDLRMLSFDAGDTRKADFLKINPRGRVPAIVDGDFSLYEANAIVEYLEEQYPATPQLFPGTTCARARVRRWISEIDDGYARAVHDLGAAMSAREAQRDAGGIDRARQSVIRELALVAELMQGEYLAGGRLTAADFALYPVVALLARYDLRNAELGLVATCPARIGDWMARIEALPFFAATLPPHWKAG